jgi:transposase-like protein
MKKRREYTPEYKANLVIEVLREEQTMSEIASRESISLKQLSNWKSEFLGNAPRVFSQSRDEKAAVRELAELKEVERDYQAKVGQLTLEVDFLKKKHEQIYGPGWETKLGFKR